MNFHVGNLPAVRAQLEREAADTQWSAGPPTASTPPAAVFNVADLPAVRAQYKRAAALEEKPDSPSLARAPVTSSVQSTGARPPAIQRSTR